MGTKETKKKKIRDSIIEAARNYSKELAGKHFLYVFSDEYMVCILKDLSTTTLIYKLSITNLEFTLGLSDGEDTTDGRKLFYPVTLRVKDSSVERSSGGDVVDFIFSKDASCLKYNMLLVQDESKQIPDSVISLLDEKLLDRFVDVSL